jgi:hypothetical protein
VQRATAADGALPPAARAREIVSAFIPSVALRSTLGFMLSPASQAHLGDELIKEHQAELQTFLFLILLRRSANKPVGT